MRGMQAQKNKEDGSDDIQTLFSTVIDWGTVFSPEVWLLRSQN